ncbi:MAG: 50S ribosomal protein L22, partial [Candidatus Nanohaloarchaea archaeon]
METESFQAYAKEENMPVSWKDVTEIGRFIQGDSVEKAVGKLEKVIEKELAVPYTKYDSDVGHKSGHSNPARYPVKASEHVLEVLKSAEGNAEHEALNPDNLYVQEFITNQGTEFATPGRHRGQTTKAAHVKIVVGER